MSKKEQFLSKRQRYQPVILPQRFSEEEMARDWTLSKGDKKLITAYRKNYRLFVATQLCAVRLYGRFLKQVNDVSPKIINYLGQQLDLPPSIAIEVPERKATYTDHRHKILKYLGFKKFNSTAQNQLSTWLTKRAGEGILPQELFQKAEHYLLKERILIPGPSVIERLIIHVCAEVHESLFMEISRQLSPDICKSIDNLLVTSEEQKT